MNRKTILIVNDDGIQAPGIHQLAEIASRFGQVWVVAPDGQRSSMSHRVTYHSAMDVRKDHSYPEGITAYSCSGMPADCVRVGIALMGHKPDVVLSGINSGYNISGDIQYSATVGAALEASFLGIHAIAISHEQAYSVELTSRYLPELLEEYMEKKLPAARIWNINLPACSPEECKGIMRDTRVSDDPFYCDRCETEEVDAEHSRFTILYGRYWEGSEGTDLYAVCNHYISVGTVTNLV